MIAAPLGDRMLLLEAFHPAAKLFEPELICAYIGTDGLDAGEDLLCHHIGEDLPPGESLFKISKLYSRFRPRRREAERPLPPVFRKHPAGDIPGSRTHPDSPTSAEARRVAREKAVNEKDLVRQFVNLDESEMFSQLRAITTLAKSGPRKGLFSSLVPVSDGVIRLFRGWLDEQHRTSQQREASLAGESSTLNKLGSMEISTTSMVKNKHDNDSFNKGKQKQIQPAKDASSQGVLWVNDGQLVGVKFRVFERKLPRHQRPVFVHVDEEVAVSYELQYEGSLPAHYDLHRLLHSVTNTFDIPQRSWSRRVIFSLSQNGPSSTNIISMTRLWSSDHGAHE